MNTKRMITTLLLFFVVLGGWIGARVMKDRMKPKWIKQLFGIVLLGVAGRMIWQWL